MFKKEIVEKYLKQFLAGETYNYYLDPLRYKLSDIWITRDEWITIAEQSIKRGTNILQALEILMIEQSDKYFEKSDEFLQEWYSNGAYDFESYHDLIASMPHDYSIRKEIVEDYSDYLINYSSSSDAIRRKALIRNNDDRFCKLYGDFLTVTIKKNINVHENILELLENEYLIDLGQKAYLYIDKQSLDFAEQLVVKYLEKDKQLALKIIDGYIPDMENERILWVVDHIAKIAFAMGWYDILDYLLFEDWYWFFLFDENYGYETEDNQNLLIWSQYTKNDTLFNRAEDLMKNIDFLNNMDGAIAMSRLKEKRIGVSYHLKKP